MPKRTRRHEEFLRLMAFALSKFSRYEVSLASDLAKTRRTSLPKHLHSLERTLLRCLRHVRALINEIDQMSISDITEGNGR